MAVASSVACCLRFLLFSASASRADINASESKKNNYIVVSWKCKTFFFSICAINELGADLGHCHSKGRGPRLFLLLPLQCLFLVSISRKRHPHANPSFEVSKIFKDTFVQHATQLTCMLDCGKCKSCNPWIYKTKTYSYIEGPLVSIWNLFCSIHYLDSYPHAHLVQQIAHLQRLSDWSLYDLHLKMKTANTVHHLWKQIEGNLAWQELWRSQLYGLLIACDTVTHLNELVLKEKEYTWLTRSSYKQGAACAVLGKKLWLNHKLYAYWSIDQ